MTIWDIEKEQEKNDFNYSFYENKLNYNINNSNNNEKKLTNQNHYLHIKKSTLLLEKSRNEKNVKKINRNELEAFNEIVESCSGSDMSSEDDSQELDHNHVDDDDSNEDEHDSNEDEHDSNDDAHDSNEDDVGNNSKGNNTALLQQENDEQLLLKSIKSSEEADREKGRAAKKQMELWNFLLDTRIKLQKGLESANTIPAPHYGYHQLLDNDPELINDISDLSSSLVGLFDNLTSMQLVCTKSPMSKIDSFFIETNRS